MTGRIRLFPRSAGRTMGLGVALLSLACGPTDREGGAPPSVEAGSEVGDISGRYDLSGVTTTLGTPAERRISGVMVIRQIGDAYTASYEFETLFPGENKPVAAHVVGVGEGQIEGARLVGTARTQVVVSTVPGVDPGFAFIPRGVTTRILSDSVGLIGPGGELEVDIVNRAAEGETYAATRTRLRGIRIGDLTPDVAAAPAP